MEDTRDFDEVLAVVKYKILNKMPMSTSKEKFVEQMIMDAVGLFGYDFIFSESNKLNKQDEARSQADVAP